MTQQVKPKYSEDEIAAIIKENDDLKDLVQSGTTGEEERLMSMLALSDRTTAGLWNSIGSFVKYSGVFGDVVKALFMKVYFEVLTIDNIPKVMYKPRRPWKLFAVVGLIAFFGAIILLNPPEAFALGTWLNSGAGQITLVILLGFGAIGYLIYRQSTKKKEQQRP